MNPAPSSYGQLSGQIALVTGATAYIGRAIAMELARRGAQVIINGRNPKAGQAVIDEIAANGYSRPDADSQPVSVNVQLTDLGQ